MSLKSYVDLTGLGHFKDKILVDAIIESGTGANITETNKAPSVKATYDYIDDLLNNSTTGVITVLNQAVSNKLSSVQYDSVNKKITATNGGTKDVVTVSTLRNDIISTMEQSTGAPILIGSTQTATVEIAVSDWSNNTCTKNVTGMTSNMTVIVAPSLSTSEAYNISGVRATAQGSGTLTFTCNVVPGSSVIANLVLIK